MEQAEITIKDGEFPPNYRRISDVLPISGKEIIFAYYPYIYNPSFANLSPDLLLHENVHLAVQKEIGVTNWWNKYLTDEEFRFDQELIAFAAQYAYGKKIFKTQVTDQMLHDFSTLLIDLYKSDKDYHHIGALIRHKAKEYQTA